MPPKSLSMKQYATCNKGKKRKVLIFSLRRLCILKSIYIEITIFWIVTIYHTHPFHVSDLPLEKLLKTLKSKLVSKSFHLSQGSKLKLNDYLFKISTRGDLTVLIRGPMHRSFSC